ncbi:hypothetical protein [Sedimentitalea sp.]|uniref:hypothetical protein n=1 Tax=Sedimentitalea sp. TaxID=2048915 RepID=UPI003297A611
MPATQVYSDPVVIAAGSAFSFVLDPLFDAFEFDLAAKIEAGIGCLAACDRVGIATEDCANLKAMGDDAIREAHKGVRFHMLLAFAYAPVWHGLAKIAAAEVSRNGLMIMDSAPIRRVVDAAPVLRVFAEGCWSDPVQASGMMQAVLDLPTLTVQDVTSI